MNEELTHDDPLEFAVDPPVLPEEVAIPEPVVAVPEEIATALAENPDALASVTSAYKQLEERKPLVEVAEAFQNWQTSLMNPETRERAIREMLAEIEQATGINPLALAGAAPQSDIEELKAWRRHQEAERAERTWIETHGAKILKAISTETGGWEVTPKMLAEARRQFPSIRNGLELLKRAFPDEYAEHQVRIKSGARPPHLEDRVSASGHAFNPHSHNLIGEYVRANGG